MTCNARKGYFWLFKCKRRLTKTQLKVFQDKESKNQGKYQIDHYQRQCTRDRKSFEIVFLGPKSGYDSYPYLSFFVRRVKNGIFDSTGRRYLNINICTVFGHKNTLSHFQKHECHAAFWLWMQDKQNWSPQDMSYHWGSR
jgi:hypothetical protein